MSTVITSTPLAGRTAVVLEKFSVYSDTKAYLSQLTRLLRVELGRQRVRVATIEPGLTEITVLPTQQAI